MTTQTAQWDVIVVGGGLAGLAAGATTASAGALTLVLEAHQPGGRARTIERDGFVFNMGAHALYRGGAGMAVLRSLGIDPQGAAPPLARYRALIDGQQHVLPTGPASMLRTTAVGGRSKVQLARLLARLPHLKTANLAGMSVSDWLVDQGLRPDAERLARALVRLSTYASDLREMDAGAAMGQVQMAAKQGVMYLDGGWAQLLQGLSRLVEVGAGVAVRRMEPAGQKVEVVVDGSEPQTLVARAVIVAAGGPDATRALFPADPGWSELGSPVTAACLDVGVTHPPDPGYLLGIDEPLYATTQSPPARHAPAGQAVVSVLRYGARKAAADRPQMEAHLREAGVREGDIRASRFLANMVVAGTAPRPSTGGMQGRLAVTAYIGPWLPEPVVVAPGPEESAELSESLTLGFLTVFEKLEPVERAVFLMVDVFGVAYPDVAEAVGKSEVACRQIASRARRRLRERPARPHAAIDRRVVDELVMAIAVGDVETAMARLAPDAVLVSDGGSKRRAARRPVVGAGRIVRFLVNLAHRELESIEVAPVTVNGDPGIVLTLNGAVDLVAAFELDGDRVAAIWLVRNPDKLENLAEPIVLA
jgi:2-polyprenyl-6-methoxyphenol hydroxylase-like FAD-dependent oxidoreductase